MNNHVCKNGITETHDDCYINMYGRVVICYFEDVDPRKIQEDSAKVKNAILQSWAA